MASNARYTTEEIDFIVAYIIPETAWYILPIADVASKNHLMFYPNGKSQTGHERYRERWCQMACPRHGAPSRILLDRPCEQTPDSDICPIVEKCHPGRSEGSAVKKDLSSRPE